MQTAHSTAQQPRVTVHDAAGALVMTGPLDDFIGYNDFDGIETELLRAAVERGDEFRVGGGAAPLFTVRPAPTAPQS